MAMQVTLLPKSNHDKQHICPNRAARLEHLSEEK
jgi:hypothetical protein